jgi:hypothetical protein
MQPSESDRPCPRRPAAPMRRASQAPDKGQGEGGAEGLGQVSTRRPACAMPMRANDSNRERPATGRLPAGYRPYTVASEARRPCGARRQLRPLLPRERREERALLGVAGPPWRGGWSALAGWLVRPGRPGGVAGPPWALAGWLVRPGGRRRGSTGGIICCCRLAANGGAERIRCGTERNGGGAGARNGRGSACGTRGGPMADPLRDPGEN